MRGQRGEWCELKLLYKGRKRAVGEFHTKLVY